MSSLLFPKAGRNWRSFCASKKVINERCTAWSLDRYEHAAAQQLLSWPEVREVSTQSLPVRAQRGQPGDDWWAQHLCHQVSLSGLFGQRWRSIRRMISNGNQRLALSKPQAAMRLLPEAPVWRETLNGNFLSSFQSWITGFLLWLASWTPGFLLSNLACELPKPTLP